MNHLRDELERYLKFDAAFGELRQRLRSLLVIEHDGDQWQLSRDVCVEPPLIVRAADVDNAIALTMGGEHGSDALEEWANVLLLSDAFVFSPDEREVVSECLHELASPNIHSGMGEEALMALRKKCSVDQ